MLAANIDIACTPKASIPASRSALDFNLSTRPSLWAFIEALPYRIPVTGVKKIYVACGPNSYRTLPPFPDQVAFYSVTDFDFSGYFALDRTSQQVQILDLLEIASRDVCQRVGADPQPFEAAAAIAKSLALPLRELSIEEVLDKLGLTPDEPGAA